MDTESPLYHGTTESFARFEETGRCNGSPTGALGVFLTSDPRVAAHFTINSDVVDRGYDLIRGSRTLISDPWTVASGHPFLPGARVLACSADVRNSFRMSAVEWMALVEAAQDWGGDARLSAFRDGLLAAGHDGILIEAWDGHSLDTEDCEPCCEYDATTVCVFDRAAVHIIEVRPPGWGWLPQVRADHPPLIRELTSRAVSPHLRPGFLQSMETEGVPVPAVSPTLHAVP